MALTPQYADILVRQHLWICQAFGFITIDMFFRPSTFIISIVGMGNRLKDANNLKEAVQQTINNPTKPFMAFLSGANMTEDQVCDIKNSVQVIPRGYAPN